MPGEYLPAVSSACLELVVYLQQGDEQEYEEEPGNTRLSTSKQESTLPSFVIHNNAPYRKYGSHLFEVSFESLYFETDNRPFLWNEPLFFFL